MGLGRLQQKQKHANKRGLIIINGQNNFPSSKSHLKWRKRNGFHCAMLWINQTERSLMRCSTLLYCTSQPALITSVCEVLPYTKAYNVSLLQQLSECIAQVEQIEDKVEAILLQQQKIDQDDESITLDSYFISHISEFAVLQTVNQLKKEIENALRCIVFDPMRRNLKNSS
jgi:hypothetical protein